MDSKGQELAFVCATLLGQGLTLVDRHLNRQCRLISAGRVAQLAVSIGCIISDATAGKVAARPQPPVSEQETV